MDKLTSVPRSPHVQMGITKHLPHRTVLEAELSAAQAVFRALLLTEAEMGAWPAQGPGAAPGGLGLRSGPSSERKRRRKRGHWDWALRLRAPRPVSLLPAALT